LQPNPENLVTSENKEVTQFDTNILRLQTFLTKSAQQKKTTEKDKIRDMLENDEKHKKFFF
jgi:hypothetical protein